MSKFLLPILAGLICFGCSRKPMPDHYMDRIENLERQVKIDENDLQTLTTNLSELLVDNKTIQHMYLEKDAQLSNVVDALTAIVGTNNNQNMSASVAGIPDKVYNNIVESEEKVWPSEFQIRMYFINQQIETYKLVHESH